MLTPCETNQISMCYASNELNHATKLGICF